MFFFNDTATTEIYTLSLHDALPISGRLREPRPRAARRRRWGRHGEGAWVRERTSAPEVAQQRTARSGGSCPTRWTGDRKSTRLNSSHANISYAVFCLKKKTNIHLRV